MHISSSIGVWIAVFLTLFTYSFLYKDNPFYKFAEHLVIGLAGGYYIVTVWFQIIKPKLLIPLFQQGNLVLGFPLILGLFMWARYIPKYSWISRWSIAFYLGVSAGLSVPSVMQAYVIRQIQATMLPVDFHSYQGWMSLLIIVGVLTSLAYFFFSAEHRGLLGVSAKVGIWFIMIGFGATFGYTVMSRISLLIGRIQFLLTDWLGLLH
jgi:hypothetical protein